MQVSDVAEAQNIGIQRIDIACGRFRSAQPKVLSRAEILTKARVAVVVPPPGLHIHIPALAVPPQRGVVDAVFPAGVGGQFVAAVVQATVTGHPDIVAQDVQILDVGVHPTDVIGARSVGADALPSHPTVVGLVECSDPHPDAVRVGVGHGHGEVIKSLVDARPIHVARREARVDIRVVRSAVLAIGVGPVVALVVAAVQSDPSGVRGLAFSDQRHIHPIRICRGCPNASPVIIRLGRFGRHVVARVLQGKGGPTILGPVEGAPFRIDLMDQGIHHHGIRRVEPHIPHLAGDHRFPIQASIERAPQPIVRRDIDHVRIPGMHHHLVGPGPQVVQQVPGGPAIHRSVDGVVGDEVKRRRRRRCHGTLGHRADAGDGQGGRGPGQAAVRGLEEVSSLDACNGHIRIRDALVKAVDVALPRHGKVALVAIVPGFKRPDGLPMRVHRRRSRAGQLPLHPAAALEFRCRPFACLLNLAIRTDPVLHVHQPVLEVPFVEGLFIRPVLPPRGPQIDHLVEIGRPGIHLLRPFRHLTEVIGHPFERRLVRHGFSLEGELSQPHTHGQQGQHKDHQIALRIHLQQGTVPCLAPSPPIRPCRPLFWEHERHLLLRPMRHVREGPMRQVRRPARKRPPRSARWLFRPGLPLPVLRGQDQVAPLLRCRHDL